MTSSIHDVFSITGQTTQVQGTAGAMIYDQGCFTTTWKCFPLKFQILLAWTSRLCTQCRYALYCHNAHCIAHRLAHSIYSLPRSKIIKLELSSSKPPENAIFQDNRQTVKPTMPIFNRVPAIPRLHLG